MSQVSHDIESLTVDERLDLVERIWESLAIDPATIPMTDAQRAELDRRFDDLEREGPVGSSWEQMLQQVRSRNV
jgi:putative addiction module component (TIGR02574 family)